MSTYLITGALRGLGLGLVKELLSRPASEVKTVIATARKTNQAYGELSSKYENRIQFIQMELNEASIKQAASEAQKILGDGGLDILINNAGVMPFTEGGVASMNDLMSVIEVNTQGPNLITQAMLPLLQRSQKKLVVNITTTLGSISQAEGFVFADTPAYKISKAALNMLNKQYALYFGKEGMTFVLISPGWLQTDMGSAQADLPVDVGVKAVLEKMSKVTKEDNGKFWDIEVKGWDNPTGGPNVYRGEEQPW